MTIDVPGTPAGEENLAPGGLASPRLGSFRHQIEAMRWRIDALRPAPSPEISQALETAMEELRVSVEELRRTNEALLDSRAEVEAERRRYRDLFDLAPDAYLVTDLQGVTREANRAALDLFHIDAHFLVGKPLFVFLPEPDRPGFRAEVLRLRAEGRVGEFDVRLKPRRLPPFDASVRVGVVLDARGQGIALRWTIRDVSERKRTEGEIKALNEQLRGLVVERSEQLESVLQTNERWLIKAHAVDVDVAEGEADAAPRVESLLGDLVEEVDAILWRADAESGRYTFVSRRAEELLGYPASNWVDDPEFWLKVIHPEDREFAASYRRKQLKQGLDHEGEYRVVARDGRFLWFREAVRVVRPTPESPAAFCGLMFDISRRKKVERQLYTAKGELASQLREMSYLHELGRRLAAARGLAATCEEAVSAGASLLGAEAAMLWLIEPAEAGPTLAASRGLPEEFAAWSEGSGSGPKLATAGLVAIEDVQAGPEGTTWREAGLAGEFRGVVAVPLAETEGGPIGTLVLAFRSPFLVGDRQFRLLASYAGQAAEAIEAALAFERLERADRHKAEALAAIEAPLAEILDALPTSPLDAEGPRELIQRQVRRLRRLIEGS